MSSTPASTTSSASGATALTSSPAAGSSTTSATSPSAISPEQSQPVDLATAKPQPLRIPTVPSSMRPPPRAAGITALPAVRSQQVTTRPAALLAVPKSSNIQGAQQVNLAVMQTQAQGPGGGAGQSQQQVNKVTVLTSTTPPSKAGTSQNAPVPRATATTIIRPPTSQFPGVTIRTPNSATSPVGATSIRLTTTGATSSAGGAPPPVQFVPVSLSASLRPQGGSATVPVSVRPAVSGPVTVRPAGFRPSTSIVSDAVRVTLVQSAAGSVSRANNPGGTGGGGATLTPTGVTSGIYKPVTISTQQQQQQQKLSPSGKHCFVCCSPLRLPYYWANGLFYSSWNKLYRFTTYW